MNISVNGKRHVIKAGINVQQLLEVIGMETRQVVVELNRDILPQSGYSEISLKDGDQLEVIQFVGGG